jgi:hypothetical protein
MTSPPGTGRAERDGGGERQLEQRDVVERRAEALPARAGNRRFWAAEHPAPPHKCAIQNSIHCGER